MLYDFIDNITLQVSKSFFDKRITIDFFAIYNLKTLFFTIIIVND